mmetsp:Transcript_5372/g.7024  ORF Transcript_5372/g.7024 Transcript_5372/m.7024 type:complete len:202 (+) Transcript_5372:123-728(+)
MKFFTPFLLLSATTTDAFSVAPPPAAEVSTVVIVPDTQATATATTLSHTSYSNLPSQQRLFEKSALVAQSPSVILSAASTNDVANTQLVNIVDIHYDGSVPTTEADEYVVVKNFAKEAIDVSGYYVYVFTSGTQGPTFTFPKGSVIKPGSTVRIYTNEVHKETGGYSYGTKKAIWNNRGGLAIFRDANGKKIGEYKYKVGA